MRVVCLDSQVLVWGIKQVASKGQEHMIARARSFFRLLNKEGPMVHVPSVVLYELLMPIPPSKHSQFLRRMEGFMIVPHDGLAAQLAAQVWHTKKDDGTIAQVREDFNISRSAIKADTLIIGTALAHGASCIYSHDGPLLRMAEGYIDVLEMEAEMSLFDGLPDAQPREIAPDDATEGDADLSGYSPAAREAIRRRLADDPDAGPEEEDFNRAIRRSAEGRKGE